MIAKRVLSCLASASGSREGQREAEPAQEEHAKKRRCQGKLRQGGAGDENSRSMRTGLREQQGSGGRICFAYVGTVSEVIDCLGSGAPSSSGWDGASP